MKMKSKTRYDRTIDIPQLEDLRYMDLPVLMPGEEPPDRSYPYECGLAVYTPDGKRMKGDYISNMYKAFKVYKRDPANHFRSTPFFRSGVRIVVSTVYLALDHNHVGDLPMFWETMVFADNHQYELLCTRYASRNAALNGHRNIVMTIREAQRARRESRALRTVQRDMVHA